MTDGPRVGSRWWAVVAAVEPVVLVVLAVACLAGYHEIGALFHQGFRVPQGVGMKALTVEELAQVAYFALVGTVVLVLVTRALVGTRLPDVFLAVWRFAAARPALTLTTAAALALGAALAIGHFVLRWAPISDDENTYRFMARTLAQGRLVAPSPGTDLHFFQEAFMVMTDKVRYGKYPIGHSALLAMGRWLGIERLVVPLFIAITVWLVARVGRAVFDARTALLGAVLFAISPQVLFTGATALSQPASALCLMVALVCLLALSDAADGRRIAWAAGAGFALGLGVLVRPLPGALFVVVALVYMIAVHRPRALELRLLLPWAGLLLPLAAFAAVWMLVNQAQSGGPFVSGYEADRGRAPALIGRSFVLVSSSLMGSLLRLDHWFVGWPFALLATFSARRSPRVFLLWGVVGAVFVYRVMSPKVGVGTAGPIYLFEALPALALLTADGFRRAVAGQTALGALLPSPRSGAALLVAGSLVCLTMFLPPRLADLRGAGAAHRAVDDLLAERGVARALVFQERLVPPETRLSWAYNPPHVGPDLDDDILFVSFWRAQPEENRRFWKRRFADRPAYYFGYDDGRPALIELDRYLERLRTAGSGQRLPSDERR